MTTEKDKKKEKPDPILPIKAQMGELAELLSTQADLRTYLDVECAEEKKKLAALHEQIDKLVGQCDIVRAEMQARDPEATADLANVAKKIENKESEIKRLCYGLPKALLAKGLKLEVGKQVFVSINKARVNTEYLGERLLEKHPELEEMYADSDPVVVRRIDAAVLDRLIAEGRVAEADMAPFRIETLEKNPAVSIKAIAPLVQEDDENGST